MSEELQKMLSELMEIYEYLLIEPSGSTEELREMLSKLNVYLARTNKIWADAQYELLKEKRTILGSANLDTIVEVKPSVIKEILAAKTADAGYVVKLAERVSRTIVHCADNIRTNVSYDKEEMKLARTGY